MAFARRRPLVFLLFALGCGGARREQPATVVVPPSTDSERSADPPPPPERARHDVPRWDESSGQRDTALAETLFQQARKLMAEGQTLEACERFEQSMNADPALGTLLNLGACQEKVGNKALACEYYTEALRWAQKSASQERARFVADRLKTLGC